MLASVLDGLPQVSSFASTSAQAAAETQEERQAVCERVLVGVAPICRRGVGGKQEVRLAFGHPSEAGNYEGVASV